MSTLSLRARRLVVSGVIGGAVLVAPIALPTQASAATAPVAMSVSSSNVISAAQAASGVRYKRGGTGLGGFDCSGYTSYVYRQVGVSLPHSAAAQRAVTKRISMAEAKPGDLVFFAKGKKGRVYHVAIYAGNGQIYHASRPGTKSGLKTLWTTKGVSFGRV
jgi:cell wall-associated NlpC family hydrolase